MAKKKSLIALIEDAIAKGATTIEEIHRAIADQPLKMLLKVDALKGPAKKIKRIQDESIGAIYDLIREINELVAKYATEMLAEARKGDFRKSAASMRKSVDDAVKGARKAGAAAKREVTAAIKRGPKAGAARKKKPAKAAAKKPAAKKAPAAKKKRAVKAAAAPAA